MGNGRAPCSDKSQVKRGRWNSDEDSKLITFIQKHGHPNWRALPKQAGLLRCGKSCRLRWVNYLKPDLKLGNFTEEEEESLIELHQNLGNKWSKIATHFPGRTDNEIKNVWKTYLKKRLNKKELGDHMNHPKNEIKENSSSISSSCISIISPSGSQEIGDKVEEKKQKNGVSKENSLDYFPNTSLANFEITQIENQDFLINDAYEESYEIMFPDSEPGNIDVFPQEVDFEFWKKWENEPINSTLES